MPTIVHVDMDAFYCAVETLRHPEYRGRPLIVGGYKDTPRAVVSSCSYEARRYGVHSAMPLQQAARLCPHAIFVPPDMPACMAVSRQIHAIFQQITPVVEPLSIDEAFLDMSGCEHFYHDLAAMGREIKERIYQAVHCTASVGIAPNKLLAKIASDLRKPDGLVVVNPDELDTLLLPLPISRLYGVGEKTAALLKRHHIHTVAEIRAQGEQEVVKLLGEWGRDLYNMACGRDDRTVEPSGRAKSIGHEVTFPVDLPCGPRWQTALSMLAHEVALRLQRDGRYARTVTLKVRYADFTTITRCRTSTGGIQRSAAIYRQAASLLTSVPKHPVRLLGIYVGDLTPFTQSELFGDPRDACVDKIIRNLNAARQSPRITTAADLAVQNGCLPWPPNERTGQKKGSH